MRDLISVSINWEFVNTPMSKLVFDAIKEYNVKHNLKMLPESNYGAQLVNINYTNGNFRYTFEIRVNV